MSPECEQRQTFQCFKCHKVVSWAQGCDDDMPEACDACWVSVNGYGPPKLDGEHTETVATEVRAAELYANGYGSIEETVMSATTAEWFGFFAHQEDLVPKEGGWSGWLVRQMAVTPEG